MADMKRLSLTNQFALVKKAPSINRPNKGLVLVSNTDTATCQKWKKLIDIASTTLLLENYFKQNYELYIKQMWFQ